MDFFSHLIIAILIARYVVEGLDIIYFYYAAFMAILADLDVFLELIPKFRNSEILSHKGFSHSFIGSALISLIPSLMIFLIFQLDFLLSWLVGFTFYNLHILFDFLTASKIPLLYPFSKKKYRFFIDRAVTPFLAMISIFILISSLILRFLFPYLLLFILFPIFLSFYIIYFLYKFITKIVLKIQLPNNVKYIPGTFPFVYYIYSYNFENSSIHYQLFKKHQFVSKKQLVIDSQIEKNSKLMSLLNRSLEIAKNFPFFSKWDAIIPIFSEEENYLKISLLLAETYSSNQGYTLNILYKKDSEELIEFFEGFREKI
ncbi:MAG: metal-dependent hydrolase [Promethearchaeati archaeon]